MSASLRTTEAQPVLFVRGRAQKFLHQPGCSGFSSPPSAGFHTLSAAVRPVSGWTKNVVAHHLKMLCRDMTDISPDHLFLRVGTE